MTLSFIKGGTGKKSENQNLPRLCLKGVHWKDLIERIIMVYNSFVYPLRCLRNKRLKIF